MSFCLARPLQPPLLPPRRHEGGKVVVDQKVEQHPKPWWCLILIAYCHILALWKSILIRPFRLMSSILKNILQCFGKCFVIVAFITTLVWEKESKNSKSSGMPKYIIDWFTNAFCVKKICMPFYADRGKIGLLWHSTNFGHYFLYWIGFFYSYTLLLAMLCYIVWLMLQIT